jgi:hypothetical protein
LIKHDGYRLMARRDPVGIRLLTRNGHDWAPRYLIVEAVNALKVRSCLIDGEAVVCDDNGLAVFERLRHKRGGGRRAAGALPSAIDKRPRTAQSRKDSPGSRHPHAVPAPPHRRPAPHYPPRRWPRPIAGRSWKRLQRACAGREIGDGVVGRVCADLQRRWLVPPVERGVAPHWER